MRYPYKDAMPVAEEIVGWLKPYCLKIIIAGSLRRKKPDVGDIEILVISRKCLDGISLDGISVDTKISELILRGIFSYRLNKRGSRVYGKQNKLLVHCASGIPLDVCSTTEENWWVALVCRTGSKESNIMISMAAKKLGMKFDVFSTTEKNWATALVVRTGSKESNIKICMEAKKRGLKFNAYGSGFTKADGSKIVCGDEEDIFQAVGLPYKKPEER